MAAPSFNYGLDELLDLITGKGHKVLQGQMENRTDIHACFGFLGEALELPVEDSESRIARKVSPI